MYPPSAAVHVAVFSTSRETKTMGHCVNDVLVRSVSTIVWYSYNINVIVDEESNCHVVVRRRRRPSDGAT
jgi:hypothetical protein